MKVVLPAVFVVDEMSNRAHFRKLSERSRSVDGALAAYSRGRLQGRLLQPADGGPEVLIVAKGAKPPKESRYVVASDAAIEGDLWNVSGGKWLRHPEQVSKFDQAADIDVVRSSWVDAFTYVAEDVDRGVVGLRVPQLGALHAAQAHWSVSDGPATIVMPTGTGKTDTMIALLVSARCSRVLVIVPTDALRTQIAEKLLTLGVLKVPGSQLLAPTARFPSVTTLNHVPRSLSELEVILGKSHVLITTSHIAALCTEELQRRMAEVCPYLFIDEAHHAEAPSWKAFKARFPSSRVVQFT